MIYFSGFSFKNEQELFKDFLNGGDYTVAGFSYGAIKAFEFAYTSKNRIDTLELISPAFFQNKDENFKKLQLYFYNKDSDKYLNNFYKKCIYPLDLKIDKYKKRGDIDELKELLYYIWDRNRIKSLIDKGIKINIYIGEKDKIIDSNAAKEFFLELGTLYCFNNCGHIIKI